MFLPKLFTILPVDMTDTRRFKLSLWLSIVGAAISFVSLYHHVMVTGGFAKGPSFCTINKSIDCDAIVRSSYSEFLGIPLGAWGLIFYLSFLLLSVGWEEKRDFRKDAAYVLSLAASLVSIILFYVSTKFIGAVCLICISMYTVNILLLAIHFRRDPIMALGRGVYTIGVRYPSLLFNDGPDGKKAFKVFLLFGVIVTVSFLLPFIMHKGFIAAAGPRPTAIKLWESKPIQELNISRSGVSRDYSKGSGSIQIVEFADLECPACRRLYPEMEKVFGENKERITFTFKNYPLDTKCNPSIPQPMHRNACFAAAYARCAGEQDKFWDALHFAMTSFALEDERLSPEAVREEILMSAKPLGLDEEALKSCMTAERTAQKISSDIDEGNRLQLEGTPSLWINGQKVDEPDYNSITKILKHLIDK